MKSKIEETIKNAREATNEMFAAFDELNERLSKVINISTHEEAAWLVGGMVYKPKFKFGDWVRTDNGFSFEVEHIEFISAEMQFGYHTKDNNVVYEKFLEKWLPKSGEYATTVGVKGEKLIVIFREWRDKAVFFHYAGISTLRDLKIGIPFGLLSDDIIRPATPEEIALLDSKLAEQGKRFDKEKLELVDIPKHKEPIIGEMAIFSDGEKRYTCCRIFKKALADGYFMDNHGTQWKYAYLFESVEQYKAFLKRNNGSDFKKDYGTFGV